MYSILYPPTINWKFLFQRPQQIMRQFAAHGWRVFYANKTQRKKKVEEIEPGIFVYHDFNKLCDQIKKVDVLYISCPQHHYLVDRIESEVVVYDYIDKFEEWEVEDKIMADKADLIFASSQYLYDEKKSLYDNVFLVRNACDYKHLQGQTEIPSDIKKLPGPIIGLVGALGKWIDNRVLAEIAERYTTILIGLEFGRRVPQGVIPLGHKSYYQLPFYYNSIDVGLIPFDSSETSLAANPIKMYEYLAAGKPIVAANLPEMKLFPRYIYTADTPEEFVDKIDRALTADCPSLIEKRKEIACQNTWKKRFEEINFRLERFL